MRIVGGLMVVGAVLLSFGLAGCAAQLQLRSMPEGALLIENGTGRTFRSPAVVPYVLTNENRDANGCLLVRGYRAVWASGAQVASPDTIRLCGTGPVWEWKFDRPDGAPNLAVDIAIHNQIVALRQRNAELANAMVSGLAQGMSGNRHRYVPQPVPSSRNSGNGGATYTGDSSLPQLAPDGSFVAGGRSVTLCPNGQYVAGNCVLTPDGTFVGQ